MTLEAKTLFVAMLVGLAHIISGIAIIVSPYSVNVTPLASLDIVASSLGYGSGFVGMTLVGAGFMAVIGGNLDLALPRWVHAALFIPQEILLLLQLGSISVALVQGTYPDGYVPQGGPWFILTDQIWAWVLAVSHSIWLAAYIWGGPTRGDRRFS